MAQTIRQQVVGIAAILAIVVIGAVLYSSRITYREQVQHLRAEALAMSSTVVAYFERNLDTADDAVEIAVRHPDLRGLKPAAAVRVLKPLINADQAIRNALVADVSGTPIAWAAPPQPTVEGRIDAAWLRSVVQSRTGVYGPVLGAPEHIGHAIVTARAIADDEGDAVGVLAVVVDLEAFELAFAKIPLPPGSVITNWRTPYDMSLSAPMRGMPRLGTRPNARFRPSRNSAYRRSTSAVRT